MGQSGNLNSYHFGSWLNDVNVTEAKNENHRLALVNNAVKRFVGACDDDDDDQDVEVIETNKNTENIKKLEIPEISQSLDLFGGKIYTMRVQNWRGIVLSVTDDVFLARLTDLTNGGTDEIAEIEMINVSPEDKPLVSEGAVFYWSAGWNMENRQVVRRSDIRFQRLITLNGDEFEEIMKNVEDKFSKLKKKAS